MSKNNNSEAPGNFLASEYARFGRFKLTGLHIVLIIVFIAAVVIRIVNNTPYFLYMWQDEAEYSMRAIYILDHGGGYNPEKLFDHPPMFMYVLASLFAVLGNDWFVGRGISIFLGLITMLGFYLLGKSWKDPKLGLYMAAVFAVAPITVMVNRHVLIDNLLGLFMVGIILSILKYDRTGEHKYLYLMGFLAALTFYTKYTAIIILPPIVYYFYTKKLWHTKEGRICTAIFALNICLGNLTCCCNDCDLRGYAISFR
jgi:4-amino-4-deoxy-L-arabinose transferase-like glycosyltransferase